MGKNIDSQPFEAYFKTSSRGNVLGLIAQGSKNVRAENIRRLHGGIANNLYSFSLAFTSGPLEHCRFLVLKAYRENNVFWQKKGYQNRGGEKDILEFQVLQHLGKVGFPVPQVYFFEHNSSFLGYPFIVMEKLEVVPGTPSMSILASLLAQLHELRLEKLGIKPLRIPEDGNEFAKNWAILFSQKMNITQPVRLRRIFGLAIDWVHSNSKDNYCSQYSLLHGDYQPSHVVLTKHSGPRVIDWEKTLVGDPAYDVAYAYHMIKLAGNPKNPRKNEKYAEQFISEYQKYTQMDVSQRLEFYKVVTILALTIKAISIVSSPLNAYRHFGVKAFFEYPFLHFPLATRQLSKLNFSAYVTEYFQDYLKGYWPKAR